MISKTPSPPYYAVIFTSVRTPEDKGYAEMAERMEQLARRQKGFLGIESARNTIGLTVSYWQNLSDILAWKEDSEHQEAQRRGKSDWYEQYTIRICRVEREYGMNIW